MKLKLQKFIAKHADWEQRLSAKPYCVSITRDVMFGKNLMMFKYSQIESDFNYELVRECRGLILDADTFEPISVPFYKFGNYGESYCPDIDWKSCYVTEKLDGCVSFDTLVKTTVGDITMEELCKNPTKYTLLSFNHSTNEIEEDNVIDYSIKPNINNWYEIELENGKILKVTGNHRIWCENLQCYRRVDELDGTEDLRVI